MTYFLSLISGILLMFCFPEYDLFWLAWLALIPLLMALRSARTWWEAAICGGITGLFYFGGVLNWVQIVGIWVGNRYGVLAWIALVLFQSLFLVLFGWLVFVLNDIVKLRNKGQGREYLLALLTPAVWIVVEWLRAQGPFAVSAGMLAASQYQVLHMIQIVSILGSYGLSFLIVLVNQAGAVVLTDILQNDPEKKIPLQILGRILIVVAFSVLLTISYGKYVLKVQNVQDQQAKHLKTAIFQPNIPQDRKLDPEKHADLKNMFISETKRFAFVQKPALILWPETIVPELLLRDRSFIYQAKEAARTYILFGTPTLFGHDIFNSLVLLNPQGKEAAFYHKRHLAPFGEYLPFRRLLLPFLAATNFYQQDYASGPDGQYFMTPWGRFACGICFESILPQLIRPQVKKGAVLIVVITNDAWFKQTAALEQHLSLSVLRAVENRRTLLQCANTGYSAVVSSTGRIVARSQIEKQQWLVENVPLRNDLSLYTRFGDWFVLLSGILVLFLSGQFFSLVYKRYRQRQQELLRRELGVGNSGTIHEQ
jgi:apolipoprotein N-acyltransferase